MFDWLTSAFSGPTVSDFGAGLDIDEEREADEVEAERETEAKPLPTGLTAEAAHARIMSGNPILIETAAVAADLELKQ